MSSSLRLRPLAPGDVSDVERLLARPLVLPGGTAERRAAVERLWIDNPMVDPEIPSLVATDGDRLVGFLGSAPRSAVLAGRPVRMAFSGPLKVADDAVNVGIVGAFLLRRFLAGPQDVSLTDGANAMALDIMRKLGGSQLHLHSLRWVRILRPAALVLDSVRRHLDTRVGRRLDDGLVALTDRVVGPGSGPLRLATSTSRTAPVAPSDLVELVGEIAATAPIRPVYSVDYLSWLTTELAALRRGELQLCAVSEQERRIGWFMYALRRHGISRVYQVVARPDRVEQVVDAMLAHAAERGAGALTGRVEPHLFRALARRRVLFTESGPSVVVHGSARVIAALHDERSVLTLADGEGWFSQLTSTDSEHNLLALSRVARRRAIRQV